MGRVSWESDFAKAEGRSPAARCSSFLTSISRPSPPPPSSLLPPLSQKYQRLHLSSINSSSSTHPQYYPTLWSDLYLASSLYIHTVPLVFICCKLSYLVEQPRNLATSHENQRDSSRAHQQPHQQQQNSRFRPRGKPEKKKRHIQAFDELVYSSWLLLFLRLSLNFGEGFPRLDCRSPKTLCL